jgi:hypothetical protein
MTPMRILIIGGGIAGMATAIALKQAGFDPLVLEQAPELTEIGSGIGIQANAMRVLAKLGAADDVRDRAVGIDDDEWRRMDSGRTIFSETYTARAERYDGVSILCLHRADLLESLSKHVPPEHIRLGGVGGTSPSSSSRTRSTHSCSSTSCPRPAVRSSSSRHMRPVRCPKCRDRLYERARAVFSGRGELGLTP